MCLVCAVVGSMCNSCGADDNKRPNRNKSSIYIRWPFFCSAVLVCGNCLARCGSTWLCTTDAIVKSHDRIVRARWRWYRMTAARVKCEQNRESTGEPFCLCREFYTQIARPPLSERNRTDVDVPSFRFASFSAQCTHNSKRNPKMQSQTTAEKKNPFWEIVSAELIQLLNWKLSISETKSGHMPCASAKTVFGLAANCV